MNLGQEKQQQQINLCPLDYPFDRQLKVEIVHSDSPYFSPSHIDS